jgi:hypothetical protein
MTRTESDRRKRQMNRRIREVLAVRRTLAVTDAPPADPAPDGPNSPALRPASA